MCGLSAIINFRNANERHRARPTDLCKMTDLVAHRGPDGEGFAFINQAGSVTTHKRPCNTNLPDIPGAEQDFFIGLGHRRLAIVELSDLGHQPMAVDGGKYWIVYNGEIYNHVELAEELKQHGVKLAGHSDTEVLLNAFRLWGPDCLSRLNGMFSFVIVDQERRRIFAARDRFGIKPLYYWLNPNGLLAFASEIKQFTSLPGWSARANAQRTYDFLAWGATDHTDETLFNGVMQLKPGEAVSLPFDDFAAASSYAGGRLPTKSWYELSLHEFDGSFAEAAATFRDLFDASVQRRMRSDVPVGACLSGGLDSSSIVALIDRELKTNNGHQISTFSACSELARLDERKWMDVVTNNTASRPHYVYPKVEQLLEDLPRLIWHQDEPFATTSIFAQWKVFQLVGQSDVKVMLDGQGADEQLAGYDTFFGIKLAGLLASLKLGQTVNEFRSIRNERGYSSATLMMLLANNVLPEGMLDPLRKIGRRTSLKPDWIDLGRLNAAPLYPFRAGNSRGTSIQRANYNQVSRNNLQKLLRFEDRNSMAFSIEARVPFMDHHLVEFLLSLPDEFKLNGGVTKLVLREAMSGIMPDPIRQRSDKLGFQMAEQDWMCGERRGEFIAMMRNAIERASGVLAPRAAKRCEQILSSKEPFSDLPWKIINFGGWLEEYNVTV
ncbi:MAG: asparagine synthase (glutamine-hydrolyzing) [Rhodobacteraceae bacterium]|nr:asparagine synthase (glutamine-hydrolyzing) [Paracoccaceae bacterium]